jgi:tyrosine-protein kinase Etk/Wzc
MGIGLTMLRQMLRTGIRDHRIIESTLGIPVLVTIPHSQDQKKQSLGTAKGKDQAHAPEAPGLGEPAAGTSKEGMHLLAVRHPDDLAIESLRSLRTTLLFALQDPRKRAIMVTSPSPSVGKSFLCANLAVLLVQTGSRVLLIDADLRRGHLHRHFWLKSRLGGLSDVLAGRSEWKSLAHHTEFEGLDLMSTGVFPADPSQLLLSKHFNAFVAEAMAAYDYVIFDVPPLLPVSDAMIIGSVVGTTLLMTRFGQHSLDELRACQQRLEDHHIVLSGCIFNDVMPMGLGYGYQDYRYAYHYQYK